MSQYSSPNSIQPISPHIATRVKRGVVSTKNFDMVPIAQQNNWLFTRMTTEEAGLKHLITTQTNDQVHDLFLLRHLVCIYRKKAELIAFYLSKQFPMPYLKLRFPEDSLTIIRRDPLTVKKGTSMIIDWKVLNKTHVYTESCGLIVQIASRWRLIENITGIVDCDLKLPVKNSSHCNLPVYLPNPAGLWIDA